jgi:hypothetical protein
MGVSVRMVGIRLGLQISKPHDKHVNTNEELLLQKVTNPAGAAN